MREIKFRAWHNIQNRMYSAEEMGQDQLTLMPDGSGFANISGISARLSQIDYGKTMIPMQYTGLKDKNGKEIYEGDLFWYNWHDSPILRVVEFYNGSFIGRDAIDHIIPMEFLGNFFIRNLEVIGNIYEHPELLKEELK